MERNTENFEIPTTIEGENKMLKEDNDNLRRKIEELKWRDEGFRSGINLVLNAILNRAFFHGK